MKRLLLSLLVSATAAFAGPEQLLHAGLLSPEIIQQIKPELGLTAEQESKMTALISEAKTKGAGTESALKEQQKTLQQMLRDPATTVHAGASLSPFARVSTHAIGGATIFSPPLVWSIVSFGLP